MTVASYNDVIIIGAGASGLMAAVYAAKRGHSTLVIDHATVAGKKMLVSGGGKCNFTNRHIAVTDYYGADITFCKYALNQFRAASILQILQEAQIAIEEREYGRFFTINGANEIVNYLVDKAKQSGVHFLMSTKVSEVKHHNNAFHAQCDGQMLTSKCLLIATGGLAWPQIGATDLGYVIARQFGHTIVPLKPVLAGFILPPTSAIRNLQGISLVVQLRIKGDSRIIEEPLLFTHQGISGPAALQISCYWEKGNTLLINFLPSEDVILQMHHPENGRLQVQNLIKQFIPERLVKALIPEHLSGRKVAELSKQDRKTIATVIHSFAVEPEAIEGFSKAEATSGGVSTREINPKSMESHLLKGLYFSGEVIDITGRLGGYNIHWAFASGYIAGKCIGSTLLLKKKSYSPVTSESAFVPYPSSRIKTLSLPNY